MSDFLVDLGANPTARKLIKKAGVPLPLPQKLARTREPWREQPLRDQTVFVCPASGELSDTLAAILPAAGAEVWLHRVDAVPAAFNAHGAAHGRMPRQIKAGNTQKPHAMVFDGSGLARPEDLKALYEFFHDHARGLKPCGRAVIITRPPSALQDPLAAAAHRACEGFMRALGKELGRKGATANLLIVDPGAEERIAPALRFLLSRRSAYVTGQPLRVSSTVKVAGNGGGFARTRPLDGQVALVTGSARGIGAATAAALAREGAKVIIMDRPSEDGPASATAAKLGGSVLLCDITAEDAAETIIAHLDANHGGKLDILIHNAGVTRDKMLVNMKPEIWDMTLTVNLNALIRVNEALKTRLRTGGRIVCLSSIAGIAGNTGQTNYAASKAGVIGYVQALAPALARKGVAINAVAPGFIETQMTAAIPLGTREVARRLCSLSQGGLPADVAEVVTFLASPGAAALCGQVLRICGGNFIGA